MPGTEQETTPVSTPVAEAAPAEPAVAAEPEKATKKRRPYVPLVKELLEAGASTKAQIIAAVQTAFPTVSTSSLNTFCTDLKNVKYTAFPDKKVIVVENVWKFEA